MKMKHKKPENKKGKNKATKYADMKYMDIEELRMQIDGIDRRILEMHKERASVVSKIADIKRTKKIGILDVKREEEIQRNAKKTAEELSLSPAFVERLVGIVLEESKRVQSKRRKG